MQIVAVNVGILLSNNNEVLLLKRKREPYANWWSFPGGKLKHGEMLREGVTREIREETTLEMHEPVLRALLNERYYDKSTLCAHFLLFYWQERNRILPSDIGRIATSVEGELSWFPLVSLPNRFVPSDKKVLDYILGIEDSSYPAVFEGVLEKGDTNELMLQEWKRIA